MSRASFVILLLGGLLGCTNEPRAEADAQAVDQAAPAGLPAHIRALIEQHLANKDFMGVVLAARDQEVLAHEAFGLANQEWQIPNTVAGKFRVGSISKQFTAAAVLLLEEEGKWRVDDPVKLHLADAPPAWDAITLHHLLTHTSGIPDIVRDPGYESSIPLPSPPAMTYLRFRDRPLDFPPGTKHQYSNSGYVLLALLIERATGEKFHDFLRRRVLDPLQLHDTGGDSQRAILARRVMGYSHVPDQHGTHRNAAYIDMSIPTGGGSLFSTSGDLLRWTRALFGGQLLSPASFQKMTAPHTTSPYGFSYGYGLFIVQERGRPRIAHQGGIHGFIALLVHYPETAVTVAVLSNLGVGRPVDEIAFRLGEWAHGEPPGPFPFPPPPRSDAGAPTDTP